MIPYHPYKSGYSVLPQLKKVVDPIFNITDDQKRCLDQKKISLTTQKCFLEHNMSDDIYESVCSFIKEKYPINIEGGFCELAMQIQEDLAIHRLSDNDDWLAATHICFPSSWSPEEKIGKNFDEIHQPIPGMNLKNSRKIIEAMVFNGPYERFVWGLIYENELNYHPSLTRKPFDSNNPFFMVKVERQIMCGFPQHKTMLFVLRQYLIPEDQVDKVALYEALSGMTPEQKAYKNIPESLIEYVGRIDKSS